MTKAIVVHELGGPEQLRWETVPEPEPGPGEARIRQTALGLNFIDVYFRTGLYKAPKLPFTPGQEGAGVVEALGPGVTEVAVGDRVAYAGVPGAYAEVRVIPAAPLVKLPDGIDDQTAAAIMLKGMTAEYLLRRCAHVAGRRHHPVPRRRGRRRQPRLPVGAGARVRASSAPRAVPRRSDGPLGTAATR